MTGIKEETWKFLNKTFLTHKFLHIFLWPGKKLQTKQYGIIFTYFIQIFRYNYLIDLKESAEQDFSVAPLRQLGNTFFSTSPSLSITLGLEHLSYLTQVIATWIVYSSAKAISTLKGSPGGKGREYMKKQKAKSALRSSYTVLYNYRQIG